MRFVSAFIALACAAAALALPAASQASDEPPPSIPVPRGWTQTHAGNGDITWKRDREQMHVKWFAFAGTTAELVTILITGMKAEETVYTEPTVTPVAVCRGTLHARRVAMSVGAGDKRVVAEVIAVADGKTASAATYLRLASDPDRPEAHAALRGMCAPR